MSACRIQEKALTSKVRACGGSHAAPTPTREGIEQRPRGAHTRAPLSGQGGRARFPAKSENPSRGGGEGASNRDREERRAIPRRDLRRVWG